MNVGMKNRLFFISVLGMFIGVNFASSTPTFEIGTWGNFAQGAISHTFDDYPYTGTLQQVGTGQAAFDAKGLHMTLFVITSSVTDWSKLKAAFERGHEIASHTQTHSSNASELGPSQQDIKKNVPGEKCVSLAYPNGNTISGALTYYVAARNISGATNPKTPSNFSQINTQGFGVPHYSNDAASMNSLADQAASGNKWATAMHHGIGGPNDPKHDWAMTSIDAMKTHLDYLDKNRSKIWCETFGNVARYIKERDATPKVNVASSTADKITLTVTNTLTDSLYNYPLSIRCEAPSGWTSATVKQGAKIMADTIITVSSKTYLMFQAVPNAGEVVLSKGGADNVLEQRIGFAAGISSPIVKIQNATLVINQGQFGGSNLSVAIFNLNGKELARHNIGRGESLIALPIGKIMHSAFVAKVSGNGKTYVRTFLPQL